LGFAFKVDVGIAADVHGRALDGAASEGVRVRARVVAGDWFAAVAADAQALAAEGEQPGLGLDAAFADLSVAVVEGQDPGGHVGRVLTVLAEGGRWRRRSGRSVRWAWPGRGLLKTLPLEGAYRQALVRISLPGRAEQRHQDP